MCVQIVCPVRSSTVAANGARESDVRAPGVQRAAADIFLQVTFELLAHRSYLAAKASSDTFVAAVATLVGDCSVRTRATPSKVKRPEVGHSTQRQQKALTCAILSRNIISECSQ